MLAKLARMALGLILRLAFCIFLFPVLDGAIPLRSFQADPRNPGAVDLLLLPAGQTYLAFPAAQDRHPTSAAVATRLLHGSPVQFKDAQNRALSFSTAFQVWAAGATLVGYRDGSNVLEGLAFVLVPDTVTQGAAGGYMGVLDSDSSPSSNSSQTFAVEIDTSFTSEFGDPSSVHIGIDLNSMISSSSAPIPYDFPDYGALLYVWIEYHSPTQILETRVSNHPNRPSLATLVQTIGLGSVLEDSMFVGFSAAFNPCAGRGDQGQACVGFVAIERWSFETFEAESPAVPASLPVRESASQRNTRTLKAVVLVLGLAAVVGIGLLAYFRWEDEQLARNVGYVGKHGAREFGYKELSVATEGFSGKQAIGGGSVFRASLPGGKGDAAVKRVAVESKEEESRFVARAQALARARLRHESLVPFLGWCYEKGELLLVYDYMPGGSLDRLLFQEHGSALSWKNRLRAARGVAMAVVYLHEGAQQFLHCNIKASNVMLDAKFNARLGDFGSPRSVQRNRAASFGYRAPELHRSSAGQATAATDVYSYGVFLLEVACGRLPVDAKAPEERVFLVDWVWELHARGRLMDAADATLHGQYDAQEMAMLMHLGLVCCHPDASARPSMRQVLMMFDGALSPPDLPKSRPVTAFGDQAKAEIVEELRMEACLQVSERQQ